MAAKASTAPRENTSLGGPTGRPRTCSGDMNAGVPITPRVKVWDVPSSARTIPKHAGPVLGQDHVARLEVAVHQAARVDRGQALRQARAQGGDRLGREHAVRLHGVLQGRAGNVGGGQPGRIGAGIGVDDLRGVEPADPPRRLHLQGEPAPEPRVVGELGAHQFHRDRTTAPGTAQVHLPHPAPAQPPFQPVRPHLPRIGRSQRFHVETPLKRT
nr:hypothetical protein GCM10010200_098120 [Actinomadura rugatobispora]